MEGQRKAAEQFAKYPCLQGRIVLITGGVSGIGGVLVEAFTLQGAKVVFLGIADEAAAALIDRLSPNAAHAPVYLPCDLTDFTALTACLAHILERFGTIDVVINNANAGDETRHKTEDVTPEFRDRCTAVNLKHQFFISQAVIPGMKWQGRGVILNMSSQSWMVRAPGMPGYVGSRAVIVDLTRTLAHELAPHGIRVSCLLPGAVETARQRRLSYPGAYAAEAFDNQALRRLLQPEEVASLALFLASDDAGGIAGQDHLVDAGWI